MSRYGDLEEMAKQVGQIRGLLHGHMVTTRDDDLRADLQVAESIALALLTSVVNVRGKVARAEAAKKREADRKRLIEMGVPTCDHLVPVAGCSECGMNLPRALR